MSVVIDDLDKKIMSILQRNCKIRLSKLSKMINKPRTTLIMRVEKLEKTGLISGYRAILDPIKLGFIVLAYVLISVKRTAPSSGKSSQILLIEKIMKDSDENEALPWIEEAHVITGPYDIVLKIWARDIKQLSFFLINYLPTHSEIQKTETMLVLERVIDLRNRETPLTKTFT